MRRVRATGRGFYVKLREIGDEFEITADIVPGSWMQVLEEPVPAEKTPRRRGSKSAVESGADHSDLL